MDNVVSYEGETSRQVDFKETIIYANQFSVVSCHSIEIFQPKLYSCNPEVYRPVVQLLVQYVNDELESVWDHFFRRTPWPSSALGRAEASMAPIVTKLLNESARGALFSFAMNDLMARVVDVFCRPATRRRVAYEIDLIAAHTAVQVLRYVRMDEDGELFPLFDNMPVRDLRRLREMYLEKYSGGWIRRVDLVTRATAAEEEGSTFLTRGYEHIVTIETEGETPEGPASKFVLSLHQSLNPPALTPFSWPRSLADWTVDAVVDRLYVQWEETDQEPTFTVSGLRVPFLCIPKVQDSYDKLKHKMDHIKAVYDKACKTPASLSFTAFLLM